MPPKGWWISISRLGKFFKKVRRAPTSLFNNLTKAQSWLWWFYFTGGLSWPHKSDLYAPTLPPTVWQSDSRKVQNVHLQDKWALKLLLYRALFLFFLSSTPIRPLTLPPSASSVFFLFSYSFSSCQTSIPLSSLAPIVLFCPHVSGLRTFFP